MQESAPLEGPVTVGQAPAAGRAGAGDAVVIINQVVPGDGAAAEHGPGGLRRAVATARAVNDNR